MQALLSNIGNSSKSQGGGKSIGGSVTSQASALAFRREQRAQAQAFSRAEAQKNRDWQERLSNTAYQRAVSDMKAAGINPILRAKLGGAETPGGAVGQGFMGAIGAEGSSFNESENWSTATTGYAWALESGADAYEAMKAIGDKHSAEAVKRATEGLDNKWGGTAW